MTATIDTALCAALHAAFGLDPPAAAPAPASPDRFPAILGRPPKPTLPTAFHRERLAIAGAVTLPRR
ncbi:hypothetical protein HL658_31205 [Azospirillum sp. RWY-5-1]|uniref:Uracil-DNA glycosylase n=1 Tax=Azospirillum oleiclasticum TaxID=2735135 RepID=A0ABX2TJS8_9PROT|nr:hypothetical protein [Azospirillum oleiclasticum]NYZ17033.1 hypothetical protein [Azospirillum oleiclasticum]NYZ24523.1 hypothetical protein [Azospirillum oleiclasticum]